MTDPMDSKDKAILIKDIQQLQAELHEINATYNTDILFVSKKQQYKKNTWECKLENDTVYDFVAYETDNIDLLNNLYKFYKFSKDCLLDFESTPETAKLYIIGDFPYKDKQHELEQKIKSNHALLLENYNISSESTKPITETDIYRIRYKLLNREHYKYGDTYPEVTWFDDATYKYKSSFNKRKSKGVPGGQRAKHSGSSNKHNPLNNKINDTVIQFIIERIYKFPECEQPPKYNIVNAFYETEHKHEYVMLEEYIDTLIQHADKLKIDYSSDELTKPYTKQTVKNIVSSLSGNWRFEKVKYSIDNEFIEKFGKYYNLSPHDLDNKFMSDAELKGFEDYLNDGTPGTEQFQFEFKLLKSFYPLELINKYFKKDESGYVRFTDEYKMAMRDPAKFNELHDKGKRQLILSFTGFTKDMDILKYSQWFWRNYALVTGNKCSNYIHWSQSINNLFVYLFSRMPAYFPIRFILPTMEYSIKKEHSKETYVIDAEQYYMNLISVNKAFLQSNKLLAMSMIKYTFNGKLGYKYVYYTFNGNDDINARMALSMFNESTFIVSAGDAFAKRTATYKEFLQVSQYMKNTLDGYMFTGNVPDKYKNTVLFTRYKLGSQNNAKDKEFASILKELGLVKVNITSHKSTIPYVKISLDEPGNQKICKNIIRTVGMGLVNGQNGGGAINLTGSGRSLVPFTSVPGPWDRIPVSTIKQLKLNLLPNPVINNSIAGPFYNNYKAQNIEIYGLYRADKLSKIIAQLYFYLFTEEYIFKSVYQALKSQYEPIIKPLYNPFTKYFFDMNEIVHLYLQNTIQQASSCLIIGVTPDLMEVLEYKTNTNIQYSFVKVESERTTDYIIERNKLLDTYIAEKQIQCNIISFDKSIYDCININNETHSIVLYNYTYIPVGLTNAIDYTNILNMFIGMLCGLKYTAPGGTFILYFGMITNKPLADTYLILKSCFATTNLYMPETKNLYKQDGLYGIFRGYKGIDPAMYSKLLTILAKLKKTYPAGLDSINIYEPNLRSFLKISKPITYPKKPYISGFLDIPETDDIYTELIEFNTTRYAKQLAFIKQLYAVNINKPIKLPTNEQILHSIMYMRKWELPFNESIINNNLIQTKIGTQILNDIYGTRTKWTHKFKLDADYLTMNVTAKASKSRSIKPNTSSSKTKKRSSAITKFGDSIRFDIPLDNIINPANLAFNQQKLAERNKYYNQKHTDTYKSIIETHSKFVRQALANYKKRHFTAKNITLRSLELFEIFQEATSLKLAGIILSISTYAIRGLAEHPLFKKKKYTVTQLATGINTQNILAKVVPNTAQLVIIQDTVIIQKRVFMQIVAGLLSLTPGGTILIKLQLPIIDKPLINLIYILFSAFLGFKIIKPVITNPLEFYILATGLKGGHTIDFEYLANLGTNYDGTLDFMLDEYPEYFVSQFKFVYESLVDSWIANSRKLMFVFDNYTLLDTRIKKLLTYYTNEHALSWIKSLGQC